MGEKISENFRNGQNQTFRKAQGCVYEKNILLDVAENTILLTISEHSTRVFDLVQLICETFVPLKIVVNFKLLLTKCMGF